MQDPHHHSSSTGLEIAPVQAKHDPEQRLTSDQNECVREINVYLILITMQYFFKNVHIYVCVIATSCGNNPIFSIVVLIKIFNLNYVCRYTVQ